KLETPSEWGNNYSEFKGDGLGAINKLLETKKGFVAGAFHKEGLGDIDLVWGNKDYGLEHILKRREEQALNKGLNEQQAKEYALNIAKSIPEIIEKGKVGRDVQGRLKIENKDILVALRDNWQGEPLKSRWVITGFEKKVGNIREQAKFIDPSLITKDGEHLASSLNSVGPNPTTKALNSQDLSPIEFANEQKLAKLESKKGIKEVSKKSAQESKKGIKRETSDTNLGNDEIKKLIDESPRTGKLMPILGMQNLNAEAVIYIQKNHKRIAVEKIDPRIAKDLKLKYPDDARAVIDYQAINHILKEHKNLSYEDIANYRELSKQANETLKTKDNQNRPVVASFNQINRFFVVVEQVSNAKNELTLKTMYKARGNYKDSLIYKKTLAKSQNSN
ncbi:DUF3519 domain-containing protein, partial [Helicobacter pylori]